MQVFNLGTDLVNYNCTGGWKAVAPEGLPEGKESILHNATLQGLCRDDGGTLRQAQGWLGGDSSLQLGSAYNVHYVTCCGQRWF